MAIHGITYLPETPTALAQVELVTAAVAQYGLDVLPLPPGGGRTAHSPGANHDIVSWIPDEDGLGRYETKVADIVVIEGAEEPLIRWNGRGEPIPLVQFLAALELMRPAE